MVKLSPESLAIAEIELIQEVAGCSFDEMVGRLTRNAWTVPDLLAVAMVVGRRENPEFTLEDARKVKIRELLKAL